MHDCEIYPQTILGLNWMKVKSLIHLSSPDCYNKNNYKYLPLSQVPLLRIIQIGFTGDYLPLMYNI